MVYVITNMEECTYGIEDCAGDYSQDFELMCDDCRADYGANIADMRNDRD